MASFITSPAWFYGIDSALQIVTVVIALLIAFYGFHIYRFIGQKKYLFFALSFLSIGISMVLGSVTSFLLYFVWMKHNALYVLVHDFMLFYEVGFLSHFFFHLAAYMILIILCLKIEDLRVMSLLFLFVLLTLIIAERNFVSFYVVSLILMVLYIVPYFYKNYQENRNSKTKRVFFAFSAIALSQLLFLLSVWSDRAYVLAHISQLIGYITLLVNLISVLRK
ncbi:MAG: hypothetical protein AABX70_08390 [Nanoarchaeota archaeon]